MLNTIAADDGGHPPSAAPDADADSVMTTGEARLFAALKAMRSAEARDRKVPAYVVMTDRSLREIARSQPRDVTALGRVHGIGATKVDTYGQRVLAIVAEHASD